MRVHVSPVEVRAARQLGRPVKWVADRSEEFVSSAQGRDNHTRGRLALDREGRFLALGVDTVANLGAYLSTSAPGCSTNSPASAGGVYAIPAVFMAVRGVFTNTVPIDAYRGDGKPEANYLIERLVDRAARRLSLDPIELRRRNMINRFPYRSALGITIDSGRFVENLEDMAQQLLTDRSAERRLEAAARGKLHASVSPVSSKPPAARLASAPKFGSNLMAAAPWRWGRNRTVKATRRAFRRLRPTCWGCRLPPSVSSKRTRGQSRAATAGTARARSCRSGTRPSQSAGRHDPRA